MVKLSILIATTKAREKSYTPLKSNLIDQSGGCNMSFYYDEEKIALYFCKGVEIISNLHETDNVGKKRNDLLSHAKGDYIVFIDSDDTIAHSYVSEILKAIESGPDCVGINGIITTNDKDQRQWFISKEYKRWYTGKDGIYYRTPNHISPVRRELALQAGFPEIAHGEDAEYSRRLYPLLHNEVIIETPLYHYKFRNDHLK